MGPTTSGLYWDVRPDSETQSGGEMAAICLKNTRKWKFIIERCALKKTWLQLGVNTNNKLSLHGRKSTQPLIEIYHLRYPTYRRELLIKNLLDKEYSALQVGRFRQSGEVQWMYDRYH